MTSKNRPEWFDFCRNANRIAVIGISASGKTILSQHLSKKLNLPVFHMDSLYWQPNWQEVPESVWRAKEVNIIRQDQWIVEGYISKTSLDRLMQADAIIYKDINGLSACVNGLKRWLKHRNMPRNELPNCPEPFDLRRFKTMLFREERTEIEDLLLNANVDQKVLRIK